MKNLMVVGSGGREHALAEKLKRDKGVGTVFCAPGNGGTALEEGLQNLAYKDFGDLARKAKDNDVDLVMVGPEAPLAEGLADFLQEKGISVFGFDEKGARLESSKAYAARFKQNYSVSSPDFEIFEEYDSALSYLEEQFSRSEKRFWVKADELCGGKGALPAFDLEEGRRALHELLQEKKCGLGERVVIQEHLTGEEATMQALTDGSSLVLLPSSQDHKQVYEGGKGPNTGGMGAYSPAPLMDEVARANFKRAVMKPTIEGLGREGLGNPGALYFGLMVDPSGKPQVLEYNVRFGDPETQVVFRLLESDLYPLLRGAVERRLNSAAEDISWRDGAVVCVVLSVSGYPTDYGDEHLRVEGVDKAEEREGVKVYHAGTTLEDGEIYTAGGRVLNVTGYASSLAEARDLAYRAVEEIDFSGMHYRTDIAESAL